MNNLSTGALAIGTMGISPLHLSLSFSLIRLIRFVVAGKEQLAGRVGKVHPVAYVEQWKGEKDKAGRLTRKASNWLPYARVMGKGNRKMTEREGVRETKKDNTCTT